MPNVVTVVDIGATPEAVASVLLDAEAAPVWTSGLVQLELVQGVAGEPGSVGLAHYGQGRRRYTLQDRLIAVTPNRHYLSEVTGGGLTATVETSLEPLATGTRMTVSWSGRGTSPVTRLTLPLLKPLILRRARSDLRALGSLVESTSS